MVLIRCDQCATTMVQGQRDWVVVGHVLADVDLDLDTDTGDVPQSLHFCGWACAATYTGARALVDS
jgi:hypothetical protein